MAPVATHSPQTMSTAPPNPKTQPWRPTLVQNPPVRSEFTFDSMDDALAAFKAGEFLVVMDDESRENEGDLIIAGSAVTTEKMAWMIKHTSGYICVALAPERDRHRTAYTITADYKHGTTTGISAHDRALTSRALASPTVTAADFLLPGHIVPLRAREGGILTRRGHTESGVDLCLLTGLPQAGVLCELVNDNPEGSMMRRDDCRAFADKWGIKMISVEMLAEARKKAEDL
ncbi:DHBP synthase RibB-like alpha/beta domain-containing protein [Armillaria fumosa]|nr:DHBP synthase RibB-like alpha/beta domain-containing protein [Armillaria fumosa]